MNELDWQKAFTVNYKTMVDDLHTEDVMIKCLSEGLLSMEEKAEVDFQGTRYQKNDKLLTILYKKICCNSSLFTSFTKVLSHCENSEHILQNLSTVKDFNSDTDIYKLAIKDMKKIYRRTFHYAERKVNNLSINGLIPALVSAEVLDMDAKEEIKSESRHKARKLISCIYEKGFEGYSKFILILLNFGNDAELYLGRALCDVDLWSLNFNLDCSSSCPCKGRSSIPKLFTNHIMMQDDDANSDSGLEPESPIARRKLFNISSVKHTGFDKEISFPLTKLQRVKNIQYSNYIKHVRSCYNNSQYFEVNEWPLMLTHEYINLALIKKENVHRGRADEFTKATLHGSIDQIAKKKEPIKLNDLFKDINDRCILVQGGPGIGKSTFALHLCKKWKDMELLEQFKLVQLVQLCNSNLANATDINDLLFPYNGDIESVASEIVYGSGEGILFVLDGYDELPLQKQTDSLFIQLIKGSCLPKCKILITSRPSVTEKIEKFCGSYISKSIEILGFLYKDIVSYAEDTFADNPKEITRFLSYINSNEMIHSMMYIPLNTAVICELYKNASDENKSIPMTMTKLYSDLTLSIIIRFMDKNRITYDEIEDNENFIQSINSLPSGIQVMLNDLCSFAFEKLCSGTNNFMFNSVPDKIKHIGFIKKTGTMKILPFGTTKHTYIFLHLTLQEFLSAVYIATQSGKDQLDALRQLANVQEDIFKVVLRFVAGLTNGCSALPLNDVLHFFGVSQGGSGINSCNSLTLNCLYEAQNPKLCMKVLCTHGENVNYSPMTITPFDYYALGYCIANTNCHWKLCCIGAKGIEMIALALQANSNTVVCSKISLIKLGYEGNKIYLLERLPAPILHEITELNLSNCELDQKACDDLAKIISLLPNLQRLDISENPFKEGEATKLLCALNQLNHLNYLDLLHARLNFQDLLMLKGIIKPLSSLSCLIIGDSSMSTDVVEEMVNVVLADSTLTTLSIMNINLALLATKLSQKLKDNATLLSLMLWDRSFCIEGVEKVLVSLEFNTTLKSITLMPWYKQHIDVGAFQLATQERIKWFFYPEKK